MKILVVDDHAIVRGGLKRLFSTIPGAEVREASNGREALTVLRETSPDIVVLDLNLPGVGGLELLRRMVQFDNKVRVIIFSMHADPLHASRALQAGAQGYISKNAAPKELLAAVQKIADGGRYIESVIAQDMAIQNISGDPVGQLTERDLEIMRLLGEGRSLNEIAEALGVGYKTVANTSSQIKSKLGVSRTADLIRLSIELGVSS